MAWMYGRPLSSHAPAWLMEKLHAATRLARFCWMASGCSPIDRVSLVHKLALHMFNACQTFETLPLARPQTPHAPSCDTGSFLMPCFVSSIATAVSENSQHVLRVTRSWTCYHNIST